MIENITLGLIIGLSLIIVQHNLDKIQNKIFESNNQLSRILRWIPILNVVVFIINLCVWHYKSRKLRKQPKVSSSKKICLLANPKTF